VRKGGTREKTALSLLDGENLWVKCQTLGLHTKARREKGPSSDFRKMELTIPEKAGTWGVGSGGCLTSVLGG